MIETQPRNAQLDLRAISPARCDIDTHCDLSVNLVRQERKRAQNPGIIIKTDAERIAAIVNQLNPSAAQPEITVEEPIVENTEEIKQVKLRKWQIAVSRVVAVAHTLTRQEQHVEADLHVRTLFDELRDPDKRERAVQRVEVLYEEHVLPTRRR